MALQLMKGSKVTLKKKNTQKTLAGSRNILLQDFPGLNEKKKRVEFGKSSQGEHSEWMCNLKAINDFTRFFFCSFCLFFFKVTIFL